VPLLSSVGVEDSTVAVVFAALPAFFFFFFFFDLDAVSLSSSFVASSAGIATSVFSSFVETSVRVCETYYSASKMDPSVCNLTTTASS
jgi:hypothetical protein